MDNHIITTVTQQAWAELQQQESQSTVSVCFCGGGWMCVVSACKWLAVLNIHLTQLLLLLLDSQSGSSLPPLLPELPRSLHSLLLLLSPSLIHSLFLTNSLSAPSLCFISLSSFFLLLPLLIVSLSPLSLFVFPSFPPSLLPLWRSVCSATELRGRSMLSQCLSQIKMSRILRHKEFLLSYLSLCADHY